MNNATRIAYTVKVISRAYNGQLSSAYVWARCTGKGAKVRAIQEAKNRQLESDTYKVFIIQEGGKNAYKVHYRWYNDDA